MKFVHLSDLHLGKRLNEFSLLEDQRDILLKILDIIDDVLPDGVFLAGDIYDKSVPSTEAVALFDDFLVALNRRHLPVFVISGNHDSPERLAFGNRLLSLNGIYLAPVYDGNITKVSMEDSYGMVDIYLLPFLKPGHVRRYFPDVEIASYTDAIAAVLGEISCVPEHRNILITHQFVTGAERSASEEISVGGTDQVDASVFDDFDYVALGHLHGPQNVCSPRLRYCGTPLKYSFSEAGHQKSVSVVELKEKGSLWVQTVPLTPLHEMVELKGTYEELTARDFYLNTSLPEDYVHITLTDEEDIPEALAKLRTIYHNLMKLDYDNARTRHNEPINGVSEAEKQSPLELFSDFYQQQNNVPLSEVQRDYMQKLIAGIWGEER